MRGSIIADFAGSNLERLNFCAEHGFKAPSMFSMGDNGYPMITLPFTNRSSLMEALAKFNQYGWDSESVIITRQDGGGRRTSVIGLLAFEAAARNR